MNIKVYVNHAVEKVVKVPRSLARSPRNELIHLYSMIERVAINLSYKLRLHNEHHIRFRSTCPAIERGYNKFTKGKRWYYYSSRRLFGSRLKNAASGALQLILMPSPGRMRF